MLLNELRDVDQAKAGGARDCACVRVTEHGTSMLMALSNDSLDAVTLASARGTTGGVGAWATKSQYAQAFKCVSASFFDA